MKQHVIQLAENAPAATYTATGATVVFWGLHISDVAVLLSAFASIAGVALQFYLALHRLRRLEKAQDASRVVVNALAESGRVTAAKVENQETSSGISST